MVIAKIAWKVSMGYLDYFPNYFWPSKDHRIDLYEIMDFDNLRSIFWFYPVFRILLNCLHFEKRKHCSYPTSDQCFHLLSSNCTCDRKSKDFKMISVGSWEENWSQKIRKSISSSFWTVWSVKGIYVMNKGRFEARISADHSSRSFCAAPNQIVYLPILPLTKHRLRRGPFLPSAHH